MSNLFQRPMSNTNGDEALHVTENVSQSLVQLASAHLLFCVVCLSIVCDNVNVEVLQTFYSDKG